MQPTSPRPMCARTEIFQDACADPARPPVLLYPGPDAGDILSAPPKAPVTPIVVDGTWSQAKLVVRDSPKLAALPRYAFAAPKPLEAIMHTLGALEGDAQRFRALMAPMNAMVNAQITAKATAAHPGRIKRRKRPSSDRRSCPRRQRVVFRTPVLQRCR